MSKICKYYLKGICRYGTRCHFLHEDYSYQSRDDYHDSSYDYHSTYYDTNYSRDSGNYYNYNKDYDRTFNNYNNNYNRKKNYNRYHVDHRNSNQNNVSLSELSKKVVYNQSSEETMDVESMPNSFFTFKFDINSLFQQKSKDDYQLPSNSFNIDQNNSTVLETNVQSQRNLLNNDLSFNFYNNFSNSRLPQQMNASFNLNNLKHNQINISSSVNTNINNEIPNSTIYSNEDELKLEDIEAFKSRTFKLGSIPLNPPTKKLCFD